MQNTILIMLVLAVPAEAALAQRIERRASMSNAAGRWRWTTSHDGKSRNHELRIQVNQRREVTAVYDGTVKGIKSSSGTISGNKLMLRFDSARFRAEFEGTVKGSILRGSIVRQSGPKPADESWTARRIVEIDDVVGTWNLSLYFGEETARLAVTRKAGHFTAAYDSDVFENVEVKNLRTRGSIFSFDIIGEVDGYYTIATCHTLPLGNKLTGELIVRDSMGTSEHPITGSRELAVADDRRN